MMQAIITINEGMEESVEVKTYNRTKTISISANSLEDAARLLKDHGDDSGETIVITPRKEESTPIKVFNMEKVNAALHDIEQSEEGQRFIQTMREAWDAMEDAELSVIGMRYLEALVLRGEPFFALTSAYRLGKYSALKEE